MAQVTMHQDCSDEAAKFAVDPLVLLPLCHMCISLGGTFRVTGAVVDALCQDIPDDIREGSWPDSQPVPTRVRGVYNYCNNIEALGEPDQTTGDVDFGIIDGGHGWICSEVF